MVIPTSRYVRRGVRLSQTFAATAGGTRDFPRYPGLIAKGPNIKLFSNAPLRRAYSEGTQLSFNSTTFQAALPHNAIPDKTRARLYRPDGTAIELEKWDFLETSPGVYSAVQLDPKAYNADATYLLDYQTNDPAFIDDVPVEDLRSVTAVGDLEGQRLYVEGRDYEFTTSVVGPFADDGNSAVGPSESAAFADPNNTGTMAVAVGSGSAYHHDYNRDYIVEVVAVGPVVVEVSAIPRSTGDRVIAKNAEFENVIVINLAGDSTDEGVELGLTLDFTGVAGAAVGDRYFVSGYGPGRVEFADVNTLDNQFPEVNDPVPLPGNTGTGVVSINPQSEYSGRSIHAYECEVMAVAGVAPSRTATVRWRRSGPLPHATGVLLLNEANPTSLTRVLVENGIYLDFTLGFSVGDKFTFEALPARAPYSGKQDRVYTLTVTSVNPTDGEATFSYSSDTVGGSFGSVVWRDAVDLDLADNIRLFARNLNGGLALSTENGTGASISAVSPNDEITVTGLSSMTQGHVGAYLSLNGAASARNNGLFKILEYVSASSVVISATSTAGVTATGNDANNASLEWFVATQPDSRYDVADSFELSVIFDGGFNWSLRRAVSETIDQTAILQDATGGITGTVGAYFVRLTHTPLDIKYVRVVSTNANLVYNQVPGTSVIYFASSPGTNIQVKYTHAGIEPAPGAVYYLSGYIKRPESDYNRPVLLRTRDEAEAFFAPATVNNEAYIANECVWDQNEATLPGVVALLVQDPDEDGYYEISDYRKAIAVSELNSLPTDIVVLNKFEVRNDLKNSCVNMNNAQVSKERVTYYGFPVNTPIGDEFTPNTRVYTTKRELQVTTNNEARGTIVCVANSYAKKTIRLDDGSSTQVTLDGSFIAAALAGRVASFLDPGATVLGVPLAGFDEIEELTERDLEVVQAAGMIGVLVQGSSAEFDESITTDPDDGEPSVSELSGTIQRQYVSRRIRTRAAKKTIGLVPPSTEAGILAIKGFMVEELAALVTEGITAPYEDEEGNPRPIDPDLDVEVIRMPNKVDYAMRYWYVLRYPIKRVSGLYTVDRSWRGSV